MSFTTWASFRGISSPHSMQSTYLTEASGNRKRTRRAEAQRALVGLAYPSSLRGLLDLHKGTTTQSVYPCSTNRLNFSNPTSVGGAVMNTQVKLPDRDW